MGSPRDACQRALGQPLPGTDPVGEHLSGLAVALAGAQLADPPDPGGVGRLAWRILGELALAPAVVPGTSVLLRAAVSVTRHGGSGNHRAVIGFRVADARLGTGLSLADFAAELAAAEAASHPDQDRVAGVGWRILSTLGEVTWVRVSSERSLEAAAAALMAPARPDGPAIERVPGYQLRSGAIIAARPGRRQPRKATSGAILTWDGVPFGWSPDPPAVPQPRVRRLIPALRGA
jgi:hypothetical protein